MRDLGFVPVTNFVPNYKIAFRNHFNLEMKMKLENSNNAVTQRHFHSSKFGPGAYILKLITAVIYGFRNKLVFVPGKPF
jgi:hypothetical protein